MSIAAAITPPPKADRPLTVRRAGAADLPRVAELLRREETGGSIGLAWQCESSPAEALTLQGDRRHLIVACDRHDRVLACGSRTVRRAWVNGTRRRVGYLGWLRRDPTLGRPRQALGAGFDALAQTRAADELPYDLTSIASDNTAARRLLERAADRYPQLPRYQPVCELITMLIPARPGRVDAAWAEPTDAAELAACIGRHHRRFQFAADWSAEAARAAPLPPAERFVVRRRGGRIAACAAIWDQRSIRQLIVGGYRGAMRWVRPGYNLLCRLRRRPTLPAVGRPVRLAYLSFVAADDNNADLLLPLIDSARRTASGVDWLVGGFAADHPMRPAVERRYRRLGLRTYRTRIYLVHRPEAAATIAQLDARPIHLEVAML